MIKKFILFYAVILSPSILADQEIKGNLTLVANSASFVGKDMRVQIEKNGILVDMTYSSLNGNFYLHTKELGEYVLKILDHGDALYTQNIIVDEQVEKLDPIKINLGSN